MHLRLFTDCLSFSTSALPGVSRQTVSYITMDVLVNFTAYLTELGEEIPEEMSEEMAGLNQLAYGVPAKEVKEAVKGLLNSLAS